MDAGQTMNGGKVDRWMPQLGGEVEDGVGGCRMNEWINEGMNE